MISTHFDLNACTANDLEITECGDARLIVTVNFIAHSPYMRLRGVHLKAKLKYVAENLE